LASSRCSARSGAAPQIAIREHVDDLSFEELDVLLLIHR
jgi:hypothetical protein